MPDLPRALHRLPVEQPRPQVMQHSRHAAHGAVQPRAQQPLEQLVEAGAIPMAVHVGFTEPEAAGREHACRHAGIVQLDVPRTRAADAHIGLGQQLLDIAPRAVIRRDPCSGARLSLMLMDGASSMASVVGVPSRRLPAARADPDGHLSRLQGYRPRAEQPCRQPHRERVRSVEADGNDARRGAGVRLQTSVVSCWGDAWRSPATGHRLMAGPMLSATPTRKKIEFLNGANRGALAAPLPRPARVRAAGRRNDERPAMGRPLGLRRSSGRPARHRSRHGRQAVTVDRLTAGALLTHTCRRGGRRQPCRPLTWTCCGKCPGRGCSRSGWRRSQSRSGMADEWWWAISHLPFCHSYTYV